MLLHGFPDDVRAYDGVLHVSFDVDFLDPDVAPGVGTTVPGDVFTKDQIEAYVEIKRADVARWEMTPSPVEYDMYYSA